MASLESVRNKHNRARSLFDEYNREVVAYYKTEPGEFYIHPDSTETHHMWAYRTREPIPPQFALIAGDFLQCLRSCLDYLVWELVLAAGNEPNKNHMFPITMKEKTFQDDLKRGRLAGVDPAAIELIDKLQPYHLSEADRERSTLAAINELTNVNKHQRILLTLFATQMFPELPGNVPGLTAEFRMGPTADTMTVQAKLLAFIAFQDGALKGLEVSTCLSNLATYIARDVISQFSGFFKPKASQTQAG